MVFSLLLAAFVTGILKLIAAASISNTLMISLVWVVYNMIPQYLLIHYTWVGRGGSLRVPPPFPPLCTALTWRRKWAGPQTPWLEDRIPSWYR